MGNFFIFPYAEFPNAKPVINTAETLGIGYSFEEVSYLLYKLK